MSRADVGRYLAATARAAPPLELIEAVHAQTEGNPLFLTETARLLAQDGVLEPERLRHTQRPPIKTPQRVREVIGKRLNRLSPRCSQSLAMAAVSSREFALAELAPLIEDASEEQVLGWLEEALAAQGLEEAPLAAGRFQFSHALIRATLYDELSGARCVRPHRRIAEVLEVLYQADLEPHLARLAHHFFEAAAGGAADQALVYAERAGARAGELLAYEEAARHYELALQILADGQPDATARRCRLLLALGEAERRAGAYSRALDTFQRAFGAARALHSATELAQAALGFENTSWRSGLSGASAARLLEEAKAQLRATRANGTGGTCRVSQGYVMSATL